MNTLKKYCIAMGLAGLSAAASACVQHAKQNEDKQAPYQTTNKGFALVELFTSEGCSSCPPADELIARIQDTSPDPQVYILAYHVDYWDRQGWKDVFGDARYSERQSKYADWMKLESVYTPQIVVNGRTEFVGSDERALKAAIKKGLAEQKPLAIGTTAAVKDGNLQLDYQTEIVNKHTNLLVAFVQKHAETNVQRGENSGRILHHTQIVRQLETEPLKTAAGHFQFKMPALYKSEEWEIVVFLQNDKTGEILSATRPLLTENKSN